MNKIYLALSTILFPVLMKGQISLNASMAPPVNSMIIYYDANVPSPPFTFSTSGTTNTWDFSAITITPGQEDTVFNPDPASIPGAAAFPTASYGTYEGGDGQISMIEVNSDSLFILGIVGDPLGTGTTMSLPANPPVAQMKFPFTYGSTILSSTYIEIFTTGAAVGQPLADSVHVKSTQQFDAAVVASGDMILPSGTYQSLLVRRINTAIDTAWAKGLITGNQWVLAPGFPTTSIDSGFYWYSDQSLEHYAHALYDSTGLHDVHYFKSQVLAGINDVPARHVGVYPNPVGEMLSVKFDKLPPVQAWSVYNVNGDLVMKGSELSRQLNVQSLPAGTYFLHIRTTTGENQQVKFIKN